MRADDSTNFNAGSSLVTNSLSTKVKKTETSVRDKSTRDGNEGNPTEKEEHGKNVESDQLKTLTWMKGKYQRQVVKTGK